MEKVAETQTVIDERALDTVRDIALKLLHEDRGPIRPNVYLMKALHQYITNKGGTPGFEVKL